MILTIINHFVLTVGATAFFALLAMFVVQMGEKASGFQLAYANGFYGSLFALSCIAILVSGCAGFITGVTVIFSIVDGRAADAHPMAIYDSIAAWFSIATFIYAINRAGKDWNSTWACARSLPANAVAYSLYLIALFYGQAISVFAL